jgi:hypothetical protein
LTILKLATINIKVGNIITVVRLGKVAMLRWNIEKGDKHAIP